MNAKIMLKKRKKQKYQHMGLDLGPKFKLGSNNLMKRI